MLKYKLTVPKIADFFPLLLIVGFLLSLISGCSKDNGYDSPNGSGTPGSPGTNEVWMQNSAYNPTPITVAQGTTITWTNKDGAVHTVTSDTPGLFGSSDLGDNGTYTHTFSTAGSFAYHCTHHSNMHGTVVVTATSPGPYEVWIQNSAFNPVPITVAQGTTITWTNKDGVVHTVTSDTPSLFDSGNIAANGIWTYTFSAAGSFAYHCTPHPTMLGTVVVTATGPGANEVWMQNNVFNPLVKTISAGTTITFVNKDSWVHDVESGTPGSPDGLFNSNDIPGNTSWTYTFSAAGTYPYFCVYHQPTMVGTMIVQ